MSQDSDMETLQVALRVRELRGELERERRNKRKSKGKEEYVLSFVKDGTRKGETILYYAYDKHQVHTEQGQTAYRVTPLTRMMLDRFHVNYVVIESKSD